MLTVSTLLANFTAWAILDAVSAENSHAVLRSSIGLYAAQLPARMVVLSIYCFMIWVIIFLYEISDPMWGMFLAIFTFALMMHIVLTYSAFGRLVMYTKAMSKHPIFDYEDADNMNANRLFEELLKKAIIQKNKNAPLPLYYRDNSEIREQLTNLLESFDFTDSRISEVLTEHLNEILQTSSTRNVSDVAVDENLGVPRVAMEGNDTRDIENGLRSNLNRDFSNLSNRVESFEINSAQQEMHSMKRS